MTTPSPVITSDLLASPITQKTLNYTSASSLKQRMVFPKLSTITYLR